MWHNSRTQMIANGTVYLTPPRQLLHNRPLPTDCYKVSVDEALVEAAFIPDVGNNESQTVKDAVGSFVAWPKDQVIFLDKDDDLQVYTYINLTSIL